MSTRQEIITALSAAIKVGAAFKDPDLSLILGMNGLPSDGVSVGQLWDDIGKEEQRSNHPHSDAVRNLMSPPWSPPLSWAALVEDISAAVSAGARFSDSDLAGMLKSNNLLWWLSDVQALRAAVKVATDKKGSHP
jgi:hypothetical protein